MKIANPSRTGRHGDFRVESDGRLQSPHWTSACPHSIHVHDRALAVALAAKSTCSPQGGEIRVVYAPTGEVIFRKPN